MPVPVVLKYTLPKTIPRPICEINPPLFPFPQEPCDPTIIPIEIGTWPPAANPPPGTILSKDAGFIPSGYLLCDGRAVSRTTYAKLFAVIGTYYGEGDYTTTFNLPMLMNDCNPNVIYIINADTQGFMGPIGTGTSGGSGGSGFSLQILPYPLDYVPPPGTILHNTMNFLPPGYLLCDGTNVSRNSYSLLYNMIGIYYGAGDGSTTFTLPNLITSNTSPFQYIIRYEIQMIPCVTITPNLTVSGITIPDAQVFSFT
jgi:microcystin-dependent protein